MQGSPHGDDLFGRLKVDYSDTTSLTARYKPDYPSDEVKALDLIRNVGDYEVRYGLADRHGNRTAKENEKWLASVWSAWFACPQPDPWYFGYAAEYTIPRKRITDRPLAFWQYALDLVRHTSGDTSKWDSDPRNAWAFELVARFLFDDPDKYPVRMPTSAKERKGCGCGENRPRISRRQDGE